MHLLCEVLRDAGRNMQGLFFSFLSMREDREGAEKAGESGQTRRPVWWWVRQRRKAGWWKHPRLPCRLRKVWQGSWGSLQPVCCLWEEVRHLHDWACLRIFNCAQAWTGNSLEKLGPSKTSFPSPVTDQCGWRSARSIWAATNAEHHTERTVSTQLIVGAIAAEHAC